MSSTQLEVVERLPVTTFTVSKLEPDVTDETSQLEAVEHPAQSTIPR